MKCSLVLFSAFIYQHKHTVKVLAKSDATLLVFDLAFIISVARHCNTVALRYCGTATAAGAARDGGS